MGFYSSKSYLIYPKHNSHTHARTHTDTQTPHLSLNCTQCKCVYVVLYYVYPRGINAYKHLLCSVLIYSNKKETSDFHGTVTFDPVKMLQQK